MVRKRGQLCDDVVEVAMFDLQLDDATLDRLMFHRDNGPRRTTLLGGSRMQ